MLLPECGRYTFARLAFRPQGIYLTDFFGSWKERIFASRLTASMTGVPDSCPRIINVTEGGKYDLNISGFRPLAIFLTEFNLICKTNHFSLYIWWLEWLMIGGGKYDLIPSRFSLPGIFLTEFNLIWGRKHFRQHISWLEWFMIRPPVPEWFWYDGRGENMILLFLVSAH